MCTSLMDFASSCLVGAGSWLASMVFNFGEACKIIIASFSEAVYELAAKSVQYLGSGANNGLNWSYEVGKGGLQYVSENVASAFSSGITGISNVGVGGVETIQAGLFSLKDVVSLGFKEILSGINGGIRNFFSLASLSIASFVDVCLNFASTSTHTLGNTLYTMVFTFMDSIGLCFEWIWSGFSNSVDFFTNIFLTANLLCKT